MTTYNTFIVKNLTCSKSGRLVIDLNFNNGLNVIYGNNSVGKSTILDLIAYALGAENIKFKPAALACDFVFLEVSIQESIITIKREIKNSRAPLLIFFGDIKNSLASPNDTWLKLPYNSTEEKSGFSKFFFDYLNYPSTVSTETSITTHQVLRLLYAEQKNNNLPIYREDPWDNSEKRTAIRDYVLGIFSGELYELQLNRRRTDKELTATINRIQSFFQIIGKTSEHLIEDFLISEINNLEIRKGTILEKIHNLNKNITEISTSDNQTDEQTKLKNELSALNKGMLAIEDKINEINYENTDLDQFNIELNNRLIDIENAISSNLIINDIDFEFCPCCHEKIIKAADPNTCNLCKSPTGLLNNNLNLLQMKTEINFQIQEIAKIIKDNNNNFLKLNEEYSKIKSNMNKKEQDLRLLTSRWHTDFEIESIRAYKELGEIETEITNVRQKLEIAQEVTKLQVHRDKLQSHLNKINDHIQLLQDRSENERHRLLDKINKTLKYLLSLDTGLQTEFMDPENEIFVIFEDNEITVNGTSHFSQSSSILLKQLFHLALLLVANEESSMRLPKFLILDGINDGGLEQTRAENLQAIIVRVSNMLSPPFQIICATSEIYEPMQPYITRKYIDGEKTLSLR
ncbi:AAA family ATPase [Acinetobacter tibetensis]|uniref:AAA family ATPase n=1 Tax=Acinetobacter tibetensis TaxID=2943497 RepID=A0AAE9LU54_9GAMM|nr:AAA family ATPase [Acinetobacter tibetensis]USE84316.1 AAA family ATPase [Acinetobacter tibetensis]